MNKDDCDRGDYYTWMASVTPGLRRSRSAAVPDLLLPGAPVDFRRPPPAARVER